MEMDVQEGETGRRQGRIEQKSWYVLFWRCRDVVGGTRQTLHVTNYYVKKGIKMRSSQGYQQQQQQQTKSLRLKLEVILVIDGRYVNFS